MTDPGRFPGCTGCPFESWKLYTTPTTSEGNRILYNKISDYLKVAYDGGGIYSLGQQGTSLSNGELIAGNVVFGKAPGHGGNALYTDGGSRYITLRDNARLTTLSAWTVPTVSPTVTIGAVAAPTAISPGSTTGGNTRPSATTAIRRTPRSMSPSRTTP